MRLALVLFVLAATGLSIPQLSAEQGAAATGVRGEQRIRVQTFRFVGNTAISAEALGTVVEPYRGKEHTLAELRTVAEKVAGHYHQQGYFLAKVVLPEQEVTGGVVTLQVFEGKLGQVSVSGNRHYSESRLMAFLGPAKESGVLRQESLERTLLVLNDLPGLKATSVLQAGQVQGTTDLAINVEEERLASGILEANNFGSRYARVRITAGADVRDGRGDLFSLRAVGGTKTDDLFFTSGVCSIPVGTAGTRLGLYGMAGNFGVGKEFAVLNIQGKATALGLSVSHPVVKTRRRTANVVFGFDARDSKQELLGFTSSRDAVRVVRLGFDRTAEDATGRTMTSVSVQQGLGSLLGGMTGGDPRSSRPTSGADGRFTKLNLDAARVHFFTPKSFLIARLSGQLSSRSVVVGEQMTIGGVDSIRGYPQSEFVGDDGVQANVEARFALSEKPERFQATLFADWGLVSVKNPAVGQTKSASLTGVGVGFRSTPWQGISIRGDVGFPLGRRPSSGGTVQPYLQVSSRF